MAEFGIAEFVGDYTIEGTEYEAWRLGTEGLLYLPRRSPMSFRRAVFCTPCTCAEHQHIFDGIEPSDDGTIVERHRLMHEADCARALELRVTE